MLLRSRSKEMSGALYIPPVMCLRLLVRHLCEGRCSQPGLWVLRPDGCLLKCSGVYHGTAAPHVSLLRWLKLLLCCCHREQIFGLCSLVEGKSCWNQSWRKWLKTQHTGKWDLINGNRLASLHCKLLLFCLLAWGNMSEWCLPFLSTSVAVLPIIYFYVISRWTYGSVTLNTGCLNCARQNFS